MSASINFADPLRRTNLKEIPPRSSLHYTERYPKERLDALRRLGDPTGDPVARSLHEDHGGLVNIHDLLTTVREKAKLPSSEGGDIFRDFLESTSRIPEWADIQKIERGQRVHAMLTPFMTLSLFSGSLIGGGQFVIATIVTALAGNITTDPTRRISETGLLLAALAFPGSLVTQGSEAHDSLTRVRLLHSALRYWLPKSGRLDQIRNKSPPELWVEGEVPINQQDMAIALAVFCYINLRSLRRMSIILNAYDTDCYVQMWRYAGYVLGIQEDLLPRSLEDQEEFMLVSMLHQGLPDAIDGDKIKEFIGAFGKAANKKSWGIISETASNTFLQQIARYLNGNDYCTGMEFEDLGDWHWSVLLTRSFGYTFGTMIPRIPFGLGESLMFNWHTSQIRNRLNARGTPTGHGAGTGKDISSTNTGNVQSKL